MSARPVAQRLAWVDPEVLFLGGPAAAEHAFWLDAGPDATSGWSWLGVGSAVGTFPRDLIVGGAAGAPAPAVPGGFAGGWVGWIGYDAGARAAGAPAAFEAEPPEEVALLAERLVAFDHAAREAWLVAPAAVIVAEVLTRRRPPSQASTLLHPALGATVEHLVRSRAAEGYRVASVRLQAPRPDVVEVAVRLAGRTDSRAVALRAERAVTRWRVTALEAGLTGGPSRPCRGSA